MRALRAVVMVLRDTSFERDRQLGAASGGFPAGYKQPQSGKGQMETNGLLERRELENDQVRERIFPAEYARAGAPAPPAGSEWICSRCCQPAANLARSSRTPIASLLTTMKLVR
jgi:hypothetical protein